MDLHDSTVKKVIKAVRRMLKTELPENFFFHNIHHTEDVANAAIEIGSAINLSDEESEIVEISSWFHDVGYCYKYDGHEEVSIDIAEKILRKLNYPKDKLLKVLSGIAATKKSQVPLTIIDKVICDADFYHFSVLDYQLYETRLRLEFQYVLGKIFTDNQWLDINCKLMREHKYYTDYGRTVLQHRKEENIETMCSK